MIARSIRFAPLPEVRQRSYSTGRNLWYEDEDITDGMLTDGHDGPKRDLVRRDAPDQMDFPEHALADSSSEEDSPPAGIFGSWKSDLGMGGGSSHAKEKDRDRDEPSSYTVKLLRPLSFGLVGKKRPATPKPGRRPSTADASDLARIESNESDVSRGSSEAVVHKSTGIPMRKTRTWELGETPTSSRRANYPPVAQRSRRPATATSISAPDPSFVEWGWGKEGSGKGVGSVRNAKAAATNDEDEDGGGMAWVKRRKAEREAAAAKKKAEDEASAAVAELMEPTVAPSDPVVTPDVVVSAPPSTSGTTTPVPATSLLSASRPALYVVTPSLDSSLLVDQDTAAPSPSHTAASRSSSSLSTPSTESSSMSSGDAGKTLTPTGVVSEGGKSEGEESEDEGESDSDSDLDEDELAQEEALAEAARMTAKSGAPFPRYVHPSSGANCTLQQPPLSVTTTRTTRLACSRLTLNNPPPRGDLLLPVPKINELQSVRTPVALTYVPPLCPSPHHSSWYFPRRRRFLSRTRSATHVYKLSFRGRWECTAHGVLLLHLPTSAHRRSGCRRPGPPPVCRSSIAGT